MVDLYRHRPGPSRDLTRRRQGQPLPVLSIARKAEARLHRKYRLPPSRAHPHARHRK